MRVTKQGRVLNIGKNIAHYRTRLDLTQEELSEKLGIFDDYLSEIERWKTPRLERLDMIVDGLEMQTYELLKSIP